MFETAVLETVLLETVLLDRVESQYDSSMRCEIATGCPHGLRTEHVRRAPLYR